MTTIPSMKPNKSNQQKRNIEVNIATLSQLVQQPDITVKNKVILQNCGDIKKSDSLTKVTNALPKLTNLISQKEKFKSTKMVGKNRSGLDKLQFIQNVEFYPDLCKRDVHAKKIKLQPKHDYNVVATTNKRKRRTPHKGVHSTQFIYVDSKSQAPSSELPKSRKELSLSTLVQLAEDQGLDDEDFMEILTCPSPVWWEDDSNGDDISFNEDMDGKTMEEHRNTHEIDNNGNKIPTKNNIKKFATKRSKLENILGKIKCKNSSEYKDNGNTANNKHNINEIVENVEGNINIIKHNINEIVENVEGNINIIKENMSNNKGDENAIEEITSNNEFSNRIRKSSFGALSDDSINDDEFLYTLENIEIPVKGINEGRDGICATNNDNTKMDSEINESDMKFITNKNKNIEKLIRKGKTSEVDMIFNRYKKKNTQELKRKQRRRKYNKVEPIPEIAVKKKIVELKYETDSNIPTELPALTKYPFNNVPKAYESPISIGSPNSETTSVAELDSISDTNIKYLDEYMDDKKDKVEAVNVNKHGKGRDGELVTVYQIVSNKSDIEIDIEEQIKANLVNKSPQNIADNKTNGGINLFYKTRKSAFRSRSKYKRK